MKPILFIWIPKTAGTSLFEWMKEKHGMELYLENRMWDFPNRGSATFGHIDVKELVRDGIISKKYWKECLPLTVVRNPYDRLVSLWKDFERSGRLMPGTSLNSFAFSLKQLRHMRSPGLFNTKDYSQCAAQVDWLVPGVRVLHYETLEQELNTTLPHLNKGREERSWREYYDQTSLALATSLYREDFTFLGYDTLL